MIRVQPTGLAHPSQDQSGFCVSETNHPIRVVPLRDAAALPAFRERAKPCPNLALDQDRRS